MIYIHDRNNRGATHMGWLDSKHTFSFGHFMDPKRMGFRSLRVINDDRVIPGAGFDTHGHKDMEIITYVLDGALAHKDSLGTGSVIQRGEIQKMSAGSGIRHSEFNASNDNPVHFLQIWIVPQERGIAPAYEQVAIKPETVSGNFAVIGDRDGAKGGITIHQDVTMLLAALSDGQETTHHFKKERAGFLHVARGQITLNGEVLKEGDGAEIIDMDHITVKGMTDCEVLLFDMA
jgi:quercetin 2,3-dioxygenase